jgi:hypothetical protein
MVRCDPDTLDSGYQRVLPDARVLTDDLFQYFGDGLLASGRQKGL